jgi:hypothetical protein
MDNVSQAYSSLKSMLASLGEVNSILESMPSSQQQYNFKVIRNQAQSIIDQKIRPLWSKLSASINVSGNLAAGLLEVPHDPPGVAASMFGQTLNVQANDVNEMLRGIVYQYSMMFPTAHLGSHPMGGLFDMFKSTPSVVVQHSDADNTAKATTALNYFFNRASQYPDNFQLTSVDQLIAAVTAQNSYFMIGFGSAINSVEDSNVGYGDSQLQTTMEKLADTGQGMIPSNWNTWFSAVGQAASNPSFWTSIEFTAAQTVGQVSSGVLNVGTGLVQGLSATTSLLKYAPWIAIALAGFYVYTEGGGKLFSMKNILGAKE